MAAYEESAGGRPMRSTITMTISFRAARILRGTSLARRSSSVLTQRYWLPAISRCVPIRIFSEGCRFTVRRIWLTESATVRWPKRVLSIPTRGFAFRRLRQRYTAALEPAATRPATSHA